MRVEDNGEARLRFQTCDIKLASDRARVVDISGSAQQREPREPGKQ